MNECNYNFFLPINKFIEYLIKIIRGLNRFNSLSAQSKNKFVQLGSLSYFERKELIIWCKWGWMHFWVFVYFGF